MSTFTPLEWLRVVTRQQLSHMRKLNFLPVLKEEANLSLFASLPGCINKRQGEA